MDALSHALLGIAAAGFSGHQAGPADPVYLACVIGSQAPDFDSIAIVRGKFALLRQHRAFSHSLPGLLVWSSLITAALFFFYPLVAYTEIFFWAFCGGLSHSILDFFNAHGAAVLWPFNRERKSVGLLNVIDPILTGIMLTILMQQVLPRRETSLLFFAAVSTYAAIRYLWKLHTAMRLQRYFPPAQITRQLIIPSLKSLFSWDFVIETQHQYYIGQIGLRPHTLRIHNDFTKQPLSPAGQQAHNTVLGEFFASFTPFSYFTEQLDAVHTCRLVHIYDLRYFLNQDFLHSATIVFNHDEHPCASYIKTSGQIIKIPC